MKRQDDATAAKQAEWAALLAAAPSSGPCCGLNCQVVGDVDQRHFCVLCKQVCCGLCRWKNADGTDNETLRRFIICTRHCHRHSLAPAIDHAVPPPPALPPIVIDDTHLLA